MKPFRVFVAGTDTGVGKTETAAALLSLLADAGQRPAPMKPYESGCRSLARPADALRLRLAAGSDDPLEDVCPHRFRAALAPGVAAAKEGLVPSFERTLQAYASFGAGRAMVVEGAGGLLVPVDPERDVVDVICALRLPVLLVGRAGLGTLNHTGLSLEALARRRIKVLAVLLTRPAPGREASLRDNPRLLVERHRVEVLGPVPHLAEPARRHAAFRRALRPLLAPWV